MNQTASRRTLTTAEAIAFHFRPDDMLSVMHSNAVRLGYPVQPEAYNAAAMADVEGRTFHQRTQVQRPVRQP
jgi:hypothetical protein